LIPQHGTKEDCEYFIRTVRETQFLRTSKTENQAQKLTKTKQNEEISQRRNNGVD